MNLTARQWFQVIALAAFLWVLLAAFFVGIVALAETLRP